MAEVWNLPLSDNAHPFFLETKLLRPVPKFANRLCGFSDGLVKPTCPPEHTRSTCADIHQRYIAVCRIAGESKVNRPDGCQLILLVDLFGLQDERYLEHDFPSLMMRVSSNSYSGGLDSLRST